MTRRAFALVLFCLCVSAADKKPPAVQIVEFTAQRDGGTILIDGRLRITGEKPISQLLLTFDFLAEGHSSIATKQFGVDEPRLVPGDESDFHFTASAPPRAVEIKIRAYRDSSIEVGLGNAGPHPIEE
jgi:hypothetical protein